jgi:outer membrane protein TolC
VADEVKRHAREQRRLVDVLAAAEASVDLARQEVEISGFRYARGLSNSLDVISAETGLLAAEGRLVMARAEAAVTRLRLRAVMGVLDPAMDFADYTPRDTTTLAQRAEGRP